MNDDVLDKDRPLGSYRVLWDGGVKSAVLAIPELEKMAKDGHIKPNTIIVDEATGEGMPASTFEFLSQLLSANTEPNNQPDPALVGLRIDDRFEVRKADGNIEVCGGVRLEHLASIGEVRPHDKVKSLVTLEYAEASEIPFLAEALTNFQLGTKNRSNYNAPGNAYNSPPQQSEKGTSPAIWWAIIACIAIPLMCGKQAGCGQESGTTTPPATTDYSTPAPEGAPERKAEAYAIACEFVKGKLVSPASAKFPDYGDEGVAVSTPDNDTAVVVGYVDSENPFSAMMRNDFVVKITLTSDGKKWNLEPGDIVLNQRK